MYASQVGPHQAASNLSLWAIKFGIENPPEWLRAKSTDRLVRRRATMALAALLLIGGFLGGIAFNDWWSSLDPLKNPNVWERLTSIERSAIKSRLEDMPKRQVFIGCDTKYCESLAQSFGSLFDDLEWPHFIKPGGILSVGVYGIEMIPNDEGARALMKAVDEHTKSRLKIKNVDRQEKSGNDGVMTMIIGVKP
jgi:hypothetical protein